MRAWRSLVVLAALFAAACSVDVNGGKGHGGPYSVEIRQVGDTSLYVVRGPESKVAAARAGGGSSAFLNADQLQHALAAMPTPKPNTENGDDHVSIHAPGFNLNVQGDDVHVNDASRDAHVQVNSTADTSTGANVSVHTDHEGSGDETGGGTVQMNIGGFGVHVDSDHGGPGAADDRAQVTLSGMSAHDARHFITEQDDLSPQVQAQMIAALGLPADDSQASSAQSGDNGGDNRLAGGADKKPPGKKQ